MADPGLTTNSGEPPPDTAPEHDQSDLIARLPHKRGLRGNYAVTRGCLRGLENITERRLSIFRSAETSVYRSPVLASTTRRQRPELPTRDSMHTRQIKAPEPGYFLSEPVALEPQLER